MSKVRVYEIAKQVGVSNKDLVDALTKLGIEVKNHMGSLSDEEVATVLKNYEGRVSPSEIKPIPTEHISSNKTEQIKTTQTSQIVSRTVQNQQIFREEPIKPDTRSASSHSRAHSTTSSQTSGAQSRPVQSRPVQPRQEQPRPITQSTPVHQSPSQGTTAQTRPIQSTSTQSTPAQSTPAQSTQSTPTQSTQSTPTQSTPAQQRPVQSTYTQQRPTQSTYVQSNSTGQRPTQSTPVQSTNNGQRPTQSTYSQQRPSQSTSSQQRPTQSTSGQSSQPRQDQSRPTTSGQYQSRPTTPGQYQSRPTTQGDSQSRPATTGQYQSRPTTPGQTQSRPTTPGQYQSRPSTPGQNQTRPSQPGQNQGRPAQTGQNQNRPGQTRPGQTGQNKSKQGPTQPSLFGAKPTAPQRNNPTKARIEAKKAAKLEEEAIDTNIIKLTDTITVKDLSLKVDKQASEIIKILMGKGVMATANQEIHFEMAKTIAEEFEFIVEKLEEVDILEEFFKEEPDDENELEPRPPVVVVMGHVDHGKTSLLDAIRSSKVTEGEQGGITQHIGASVVSINGHKITFLDTPGHEAFTAMRLRGAMATDIAILVVAADDGVMPQTIEAINHAKAAGLKIIVAVNKIDKPGANPDRVKQELVEYQLIAEEWGGDTICVDVSATEKTNLDQLLEMILLVSEMEEFKANPKKTARGTVIEAQLDKGKGPVATVLVQHGTLNVGDAIVAGTAYGRIRAMVDDKGRRVKQAGPSTPVEVLGLSEAPSAGDAFYTAKNEREARHIAEKVLEKNREKLMTHTPHKVTLDDLFSQIQAGDTKELKLIVKADVQGSLEAVRQSLVKLSNEKVMINVIHGGVGAINESDVMLASASNAIIIGFNVRPEVMAKVTADIEAIDIRLYRVIYNAIEDIEAAMKGMLDPEFVEKVLGHAQVRQTFKVSGVGTIAGAYVIDGKITRKSKARLLRDNVVVFEGDLDSLKRFKDDAKEVNTNYECGFTLAKFNDLKEGDVLEAYIMEEIPR